MKRKPTASAKKATREMSGGITRRNIPRKEIIQEQTDPNLKGKRKAEKEKINFNLHTKGKNKTRKRRFSGNEFN